MRLLISHTIGRYRLSSKVNRQLIVVKVIFVLRDLLCHLRYRLLLNLLRRRIKLIISLQSTILVLLLNNLILLLKKLILLFNSLLILISIFLTFIFFLLKSLIGFNIQFIQSFQEFYVFHSLEFKHFHGNDWKFHRGKLFLAKV